MKQLLFLLCAILLTLSVQAQTAQVATLSHEGNITTYYSGNALKDAVNAAVDGDIITLSSGTFSSPSEIKKNLTIRGAGMMPDEDPTILTGNLTLACPQGDNASMTLEGFYHNGTIVFAGIQNAKLVKVWVNYANFHNYYNKNISILHSIFEKFSIIYGKTDLSMLNCVIQGVHNNSSSSPEPGSCMLTNCIVLGDWSTNFKNTEYKNCILTGIAKSDTGQNTSTHTHCYYFGPSTNPFPYSISDTNVINNDLSADKVFEETLTYTLSEEHQKEWLGNDGTQVGIHGGLMPFDPTPTNPQITKFNVAPKTTADGKLSVDIEVKTN